MLDNRSVTPEKLATVANRILHPYTIEVRDVGWWSVYQIGQRLCDKFDDVPVQDMATRLPRVFIAGDACHTHSAKAGQGMNVSMADAWNLGWKLACRAQGDGQAGAPAHLLRGTSGGRQAAHRLRPRVLEIGSAPTRRQSDDGEEAEEFQQYFIAQGRFTAGVATRYARSMITAEPVFQDLAEGFPVGMRFHSAPVVRLADAKPVHLGHVARRRRRLARLPLRRPGRPDDRHFTRLAAMRVLGIGRVPDRTLHARGRRAGLGDRCPCRSSSNTIVTWQ